MNPKRPLLLLIAFALFAPSLSAQVVQDYPGGGDLGYHDSGQPFTEMATNDDELESVFHYLISGDL